MPSVTTENADTNTSASSRASSRLAAAAPPKPTGAEQSDDAADLADGGERVQLIRRRVGGPLHTRPIAVSEITDTAAAIATAIASWPTVASALRI